MKRPSMVVSQISDSAPPAVPIEWRKRRYIDYQHDRAEEPAGIDNPGNCQLGIVTRALRTMSLAKKRKTDCSGRQKRGNFRNGRLTAGAQSKYEAHSQQRPPAHIRIGLVDEPEREEKCPRRQSHKRDIDQCHSGCDQKQPIAKNKCSSYRRRRPRAEHPPPEKVCDCNQRGSQRCVQSAPAPWIIAEEPDAKRYHLLTQRRVGRVGRRPAQHQRPCLAECELLVVNDFRRNAEPPEPQSRRKNDQ